MKWIKKGKIFDPSKVDLGNGCTEFAQSPQTLEFDNFIRIYFSTRKRDAKTGAYLSFISFIDMDKEFKNVLNISSKPVIELGDLGSFDEHGIFPINILKDEDKILAYTCGWSRRISVPVETSIGLAMSNDNGESFVRMGNGPVLTSSLLEPVLVGDGFVRKYEGIYHMWYIFGKKWMAKTPNEPVARVYKIAHATSVNCEDWVKQDGQQIISDKLNADECQALPTVLKIGNRYHMYFCFRQATDFRTNPSRGYRLGYAFSDDLINWTRDDANSGMETTDGNWDSDMMCYPHIFRCNEKVCLLYNGNEFGKNGFGLAILENE